MSLGRSSGVQLDLSDMFSATAKTPKSRQNKQESSNSNSNSTSDKVTGKCQGCNVTTCVESSTPVLNLNDPRREPWIDFDAQGMTNVVGKTSCVSFLIVAPSHDDTDPNDERTIMLEVERMPSSKGFVLHNQNPNHTADDDHTHTDPSDKTKIDVNDTVAVKVDDRTAMWVTWKPTAVGPVKDSILFKLPRGWAKVALVGHATANPSCPKQSARKVCGIPCGFGAVVSRSLSFPLCFSSLSVLYPTIYLLICLSSFLVVVFGCF